MSTAQKLKHKVVLCTQSQLRNMISSGTVESGVDYRVTDVEAATIDDIVNSTADFSQNDQTATNYVKNRTHYISDIENLQGDATIGDTYITWSLTAEEATSFRPNKGDILQVTFYNGIEDDIVIETEWYHNEGFEPGFSVSNVQFGEATISFGGNYDENGKFHTSGGGSGSSIPFSSECHLKFKTLHANKLDEKFIPDTIVRTEQIPHELFNKVILNGDQDDFVEIISVKTFSFNWDTSKGSISSKDIHVYFDDVELVYLPGSGDFDYARLNLGKIMSESSTLQYCSLTVWNQNSDKYGTIDVTLSSNAPSTFSCRIEYDDAYYCKQLESKYVSKQSVLPEIITITGSDIIANMHPNKAYHLTVNGAISSIYLNINDTYAISDYDNEWKGYFDTNANAPDPTFSCAQDINWLGGTPTLVKGHHYEFSITKQGNSYYGVMVEFQILV